MKKVELLEGQVYADDIKYDVKDAYKITKKHYMASKNKKEPLIEEIFFVNTEDFLGRPIEKSPNTNEIRSLEVVHYLSYICHLE